LIDNNFYNTKSDIIFFDILERYFIWNTNYKCSNRWIGIIHCTQNTPDYLNIVNIKNLFKNKNFIESLANCIYIISLSNYVAEYIKNELLRLNITINIIVLKHPVDIENIKFFDFDKFLLNDNKQIIQIGQQLRKMTSIYLLETKYKKLWLTGTKNLDKCKLLLNKELEYLKITKKINYSQVEMKYVNVEEFDTLLQENIVFIDLFDASANNTILECIIRNTPIIVNKLPAVIEYLGEEYPLYFNDIKEVSKIITNTELIRKGYEYLKEMNKEEYKIKNFIKKIYTMINCVR
jgi:hypothetical protein